MFNVQSTAEVEAYFIRCLDDLNWHYPIAEICLPEYAKLIARQILNKEIGALEGCNEIYKVYRGLDHEPDLVNWDYLSGGMHPETYEDLIFEKNGIEDTRLLEEAIREEAGKLVYGKKTTVHQYSKKPDFEFAETEPENILTKIWKKIF